MKCKDGESRKITALVLDGVRYLLNDQGRHVNSLGRAKRRDLKAFTREWTASRAAERPSAPVPPAEPVPLAEPVRAREVQPLPEDAAAPMGTIASQTSWVALDVGCFGEDDADSDWGGPLANDFDRGSYWDLD
jgi:hypothetical protein